jgi:N-acetylated-alpha-linked acidic dipeptidase
MDAQIRPIWNNIAILRGVDEPEKLIILGGHRDAWVFGAQDPNSGSAVLLETARILGILHRNGWRPKRSILVAQWDAEEYGMIGSTEWAEENGETLLSNAVVYLNFDGTISGPTFGASAVPSLDRFVESLTRDVIDPASGQSVFSVWWKDQHRRKLRRLEETLPENAAVSVGRMGGGSDHVVFLNHLGVPSMGFGFGGPSGVYHSYHDNLDWMERFGDPGFRYHAAAARMAALAAMRLASCDLLPFSLASYADEILQQLSILQRRLAEDEHADSLSLTGLHQRAEAWHQVAVIADSLLRQMRFARDKDDTLNALLSMIERTFVPEVGLSDRPWYRHRVVTASGYASIGLPGVSGAADRREWNLAQSEAALLESLLDRVIGVTDAIVSLAR